MDAVSDTQRRALVLIHTALGASLGLYPILLLLLRREAPASPREGYGLFLALFAVGIGQFLTVSLIGRRMLAARRGDPLGRVRSYFLIRGAAAEAIGIFGLVLGMLGAPLGQALALVVVAAAALLSAAPSHAAWEATLRVARGEA